MSYFSESDMLKMKESRRLRDIDRLGPLTEFNVNCSRCNKEFIVTERAKKFPSKKAYFCCRGCANSRNHSNETKAKMAESSRASIRAKWEDPEYRNKCLDNNPVFSSKAERLIRDYFIANYPNDKWTYGGNLKFGDARLIRDLYSDKLRICFEYDGVWHFKDIKGQLANKQTIDKALEAWCIANNYRLIRIDEELFVTEPDYYINVIEEAIYTKSDSIIKIGNRYG